MTYKKDDGKPPLSLLSTKALVGVARVMAFGAKKYSTHGWRDNAGEWSRMLSAAMRHITAFNDGEDFDPETGESHIDHAMCCLMFLSEYQKAGLGDDDRYRYYGRAEGPS